MYNDPKSKSLQRMEIPVVSDPSFSEDAVRGTGDDASASKVSCSSLGYLRDPYAKEFVRFQVRRSPLINRGYYARVYTLRKIVRSFLDVRADSNGSLSRQVISLGAGYDTSYFLLRKEGLAIHKYVEVDFYETTTRKAKAIKACEEMHGMLGEGAIVDVGNGRVKGDHYELFPADLRRLNELDVLLEEAGIDRSIPTLLIAECVLVYIDPEVSLALMKWAANKFLCSLFLVYDMINGEDPFGRQMIFNLKKRGIQLPGLSVSPTVESYRQRLLSAGYVDAQCVDMNAAYAHIEPAERRRIERLEIMDELEEWNLIMAHYCVAYGINDPQGTLGMVGIAG